ncbi:MAG: PAS domain-containing sensor histidine kinase [Desulfomonilaceae bacterium]
MRKSLKNKEEQVRELAGVNRKAAQLRQLESERRRVGEALRQSETMFRKITEKSIVGVYLIQDYVFRYVNPKMAEFCGYEVSELVDTRGPKDVVWHEDWPLVKENLRKRISGEMEAINYRFRGIKPTGEIVHMEVYGSRTDYQGKPAVIGTILDISDRVKAEERLAQSENELRHLSAQLLRAQEDERKRLAQELHDGIGQSVSAIKFMIETCMKQIRENPESDITAQLKMLLPMAQNTVEEVQRIAVDLRPFIIDDLGLVATLRWFLRQFQNMYSDIRLDNRIGLEEQEIPESLKIVIFRIAQEALNNVARHSRAKRVHVALRKRKDRIELLIRDNGVGIAGDSTASSPSCGKGFGFSSMKERTEFSGGIFSLETGPGLGISIRASWPHIPVPSQRGRIG